MFSRFCRSNKAWKMCLAPLLSRFNFVSQIIFLLERPALIVKVLLGTEKYLGLENDAAIHFLIDFHSLFHENKRCLAASTKFSTICVKVHPFITFANAAAVIFSSINVQFFLHISPDHVIIDFV